jgi:Polysaccharide lyase
MPIVNLNSSWQCCTGIEIPNTNKNKPHVSCVNDMGPSVQLTIYKNDDDSASTKPQRQRIEMKVHDGSPTSYKATRETNYVYTWWFKLDQGMVVSDSFFHIFQLKAVGNVPDMPVFTLSLSNEDGLHMRSNVKGTETLNPSTDFLKLLPLKSVVGTWIQATVEVNYSNTPSNGYVKVSLKSQDGRPLADKQKSFRTYLSGAQFVRPKWGLYRQINNAFRPSDTELFQNIQIWKRK